MVAFARCADDMQWNAWFNPQYSKYQAEQNVLCKIISNESGHGRTGLSNNVHYVRAMLLGENRLTAIYST